MTKVKFLISVLGLTIFLFGCQREDRTEVGELKKVIAEQQRQLDASHAQTEEAIKLANECVAIAKGYKAQLEGK